MARQRIEAAKLMRDPFMSDIKTSTMPTDLKKYRDNYDEAFGKKENSDKTN